MTTKKAPPKKPAKPTRKTSDIPLENIPERKAMTLYTVEQKQEAVNRYNAGEGAEEIARSMGISNGTLITKWARTVAEGLPLNSRRGGAHPPRTPADIGAALKESLAVAMRARDDRLEAAACIVEGDGASREAEQLAAKVRALKRGGAG